MMITTKQDEIEFERAIRDDFGFIDLHGTMTQVLELRKELVILKSRAADAKKEATDAAERISYALMHLRTLHDAAESVLSATRDAYNKVTR